MANRIDTRSLTAAFDRSGKEISDRQFEKYRRDDAYRYVGFESIGPYKVITIWTGIKDPFGEPSLFETTVFRVALKGEDGPSLGTNKRWVDDPLFRSPGYHTEAEAVAGHHAMAEAVRKHVRDML